jgi:hypothetical protein
MNDESNSERSKYRLPEVFLGCLLTLAVFSVGMLLTAGTWLTKDAAGFFTFALVIVGVLQAALFFVQLRLIRQSLTDAKTAADAATEGAAAARLNAEAVMAAEGAHLYPIIKADNLKAVFQGGIWYENSGADSDNVPTPEVIFRFKNYGKTPAVLESVMHGIEFFETPSTLRTMHAEERNIIEVLGAGEETADFTIEMLGTFNRGMAKSVREYRGELLFFGEAVFKDFFNRHFRCIWESDGRTDGFRLVRHEQYEDLDSPDPRLTAPRA